MNPTDPNQQPAQPQQPAQEPVQYPAPEAPAPQAPVEPSPVPTSAPTPVAPVEAPVAAPNPFGGSAPVSSEVPAASPFGQAPVAPIGSSPNSDPTPNFAGGSKKKLIILISAIAGGLVLLAGIALAVYFIFFSVSKADYKQAYDQLQTIQESVASSSITSDSASLTTKFEEFKTENAKLSSLKALRADGDLNKLYKAYDAKATAYIKFLGDFIPSYEKLSKATDTVSSGSLLKSSAVQETITALESASDASDPTIKAYVDSLLAAYKEMLPQVKIYESSTSSSERLKAITAISASTKGLSAASSKFSDDLKARYDEVSPKETFDALSSAVTKKYNTK